MNEPNNSASSVEALRRKVQNQLKQSGMDTAIKKMVESICATKDDLLEINAEEVLETIYSRGLMDAVLKFETVDAESSTRKVQLPHNQIKTSNKNGTWWLEKLQEQECVNDDVKARRYYFKIEILGGKAFLDHLSQHNSNDASCRLTLHLFFKSQRFKTKPVDFQCNPCFRDEFVIDIGQFGGSVVKLLTVDEPLKILVIREDPTVSSGGGVVTSFTLHDFRSVLLSDNGTQSFHLELLGTGPESNLPVGLLNLRTSILPCPDEQISESTFMTHIHSEKSIYEESTRFFVFHAKEWMNEFLSIRPGHVFRNVKLFAFDQQMISRPLMLFTQTPLNVDRVFETPFHAAWFVSLFTRFSSKSNMDAMPSLQTLESTIISKSGTDVDLAILLCSLLIGFGLNAFVAFGLDNRKTVPASWVVSFSSSFEPTLWDPVAGKRECVSAAAKSEKLINLKSQFSRSLNIGCLFNSEKFYSNIQSVDSVLSVDWNLLNPTKWKCLSPKIIAKLQRASSPLFLLTSTLDCELLAFNMELEIQELIQETRNRQGQSTRWDGTTSKYMGQRLATYELKASTGGSSFANFFEDVIMRSIPEGYDFKGYHHQCCSTNAKNLFHLCMKDSQCQEVVNCRGQDVRMALRVSIFPYPENVTSVRIMIGCKFMAVDA